MSASPRLLASIAALAAYAAVVVLQAWPLPLHLSTHLTGQPTGDTGVYVWNLWVFRQELLGEGHWPFQTMSVLPLDGPTDLTLHNYTPFANLLAVPLIPWLGLITTFNVIYLFNVALAGFGMFLLARHLTGRVLESWLAGLMFAASPFLVARSEAHFSLVAAAPLPIFTWLFDRAWTSHRWRDALAAGACVAWAWACDPYYAVYCGLLAACVMAGRTFAMTAQGRRPTGRHLRTVTDLVLITGAALVASVHVAGGGTLQIASLSISMRSLYTPVLLLTLLAVLRVLLTWRPRIIVAVRPPWSVMRTLAGVGVASLVLMAPVLVALASRLGGDGGLMASVPWRSSAPGVDLLGYLLPNPRHALAPESWARWLAAQPGEFAEHATALPFVALFVIGLAWWRGFRLPRTWLAMALGFGLLSLGPFITVAGVNTHIPTPWALLRYVPVLGAARMPSRLSVLVILAIAAMLAMALTWLADRYPHRRRLLVTATALGLAFELTPVPRRLFAASVPAVYETIARDPRPVRVLQLPFGIRDGLSSLGDYGPQTQFYQTQHGKGLIGGYLSRVPARTKDFYMNMPVVDALVTMSEGRPITSLQIRKARAAAAAFIEETSLGYVVMERQRVTPELREFAIDLLDLEKIGESARGELFVPRPRAPTPPAGPGG